MSCMASLYLKNVVRAISTPPLMSVLTHLWLISAMVILLALCIVSTSQIYCLKSNGIFIRKKYVGFYVLVSFSSFSKILKNASPSFTLEFQSWQTIVISSRFLQNVEFFWGGLLDSCLVFSCSFL